MIVKKLSNKMDPKKTYVDPLGNLKPTRSPDKIWSTRVDGEGRMEEKRKGEGEG